MDNLIKIRLRNCEIDQSLSFGEFQRLVKDRFVKSISQFRGHIRGQKRREVANQEMKLYEYQNKLASMAGAASMEQAPLSYEQILETAIRDAAWPLAQRFDVEIDDGFDWLSDRPVTDMDVMLIVTVGKAAHA